MKILYVYREKEKKEHSIEAVFDTVSETMKSFGHEVYKWYKPVSWRQTLREIRQLRKGDYDVFHITGDVNYLWFFFPWKKTTMTCHDIGMYKNNPKTIIRTLYVVISFILSTIFLKKITAVSELTKNDLVKILHVKSNKIQVIPNPLSLPVHKCSKPFKKDCPVILQIGSGWHKNLQGLIESAKGINCHLDIVGQPSKTDMAHLKEYGFSYTISHHITVQELICKYENCDILYFVSRSEGFGMPIIEAQTVGRVVMTSNTEPTKSVAGGAALLFDPEDHLSMHQGLLQLVNNNALRERIIEDGYQNAQKYQPVIIGRQYEQFYKNVFNLSNDNI